MVAVFLMGWGAVATTERVEAFVGESLVVNPVTKALTEGAEKVLKTGKAVPETIIKAGGSGGVAAASRAAGIFQAGAVVPALGSVVAFGAGTVVGSEICSVIGIEGCWYHGSEGADPPLVQHQWVYKTTATPLPLGGQAPAWNWVWQTSTGTNKFLLVGYGDTDCDNLTPISPPAGASEVLPYEVVEGSCKKGGVFKPVTAQLVLRYSMENRVFEYHGTDNPAIPNYAYSAPSDWSKKMYSALVGGAPGADEVGQQIASEIPGSGVSSPYALTVEVPNCDGLLYPACRDLIEERGLDVIRVTRTWETADLDSDPDEVLELDPKRATEVEKGTAVKVVTNPDEAGMPIVIPSPEPGETYDDYAARLNPALAPTRVDLGEAYIDPAKGPSEVVTTSPAPETRLDPTTGHDVTVRTNPETAPIPPAGWMPPGIPAVDFAPLEGLGSCSVFPFGVLCWLGEALAQFNTAGVCPHFAAPVDGLADTDFEVTLCGETADTIMGYLRPAMLLAFTVGTGFLFARATRAIGSE